MQSFLGDGATIATSPLNPDVIASVGYVYTSSHYWPQVSISTDRGNTWTYDTLDFQDCRANALAFDPVDLGRLYVAGDSYYNSPLVLVTTDLGLSWAKSHAGMAGAVWSITVVPHDPNSLYAGTLNGVHKSTDAGATWTRVSTFLSVKAVVVDTVNREVIYAAGYYGVYSSTDAGQSWADMNAGLDTADVLSLALRSGPNGALYCGTSGRGVYVTDPLVAVEEGRRPAAHGSRLPTVVGRILFLPPADRTPHSSLFSLSGRKVMPLRPGPNDASRLAAGVYFVRADDGEGRSASRVVIVRPR
jgi:photosystem II stability/assembly factor-like uncharacterized protein